MKQSPEVRRIAEAVRCRVSGRIEDFAVQETLQGLILKGRARSYYIKQLAQHAVMETTTMPIVANEVEVF